MSESSSFSFRDGVKSVVDNDALDALKTLERHAPNLLRNREFVVATTAALFKAVAYELIGPMDADALIKRIADASSLKHLSQKDSAAIKKIQLLVAPKMHAIFERRTTHRATNK
jgi:hypothetical protein